jgi:signal transduction histidine kinase/ActR/RegA family two-component response regulator
MNLNAEPRLTYARGPRPLAAARDRIGELERWLARHERAATLLAEVGRDLIQAFDPRLVGQRIVDSVCALMGAESAVLFRLDPATEELVSVAASGSAAPFDRAGVVLGRGMGLEGLAVSQRCLVSSPNILADPRVRLDPEGRQRVVEGRCRAAICAPLGMQGRVVGILSLGDRAGRTFRADEIRLLQAFADQAALSFEQARLYEEARRREAAVEQERVLLQTTLEHLGQAVSVVDRELRLVAWNTQFLDFLEFPREFGQVGKPFEDFVRYNAERGEYGPGDPEQHVRDRVALARRFEPHAFQRVRPDGRVIEVRGSPMPGGGFVTTYTDVTEREQRGEALRRSEARLRQAQKMEAVGRLAGGVAHDFNNLLTVIAGRGEILLRQLPTEDPRRRHADLIRQTAFRAADLTRQLLAFSRKQVLQPKVLDLNGVVEGMDGMLRRLIGEHIELRCQCRAVGAIKADPSQLEQIIVNLAVNARDAMLQGGVLSVETTTVELDDAFARSHDGARPGPHVLLAVTDNGAGMDADTRAHLFEPFFTTKGPGQGTGLGLATVYGIVEQSGGLVLVESELGQGTRFELYFPVVADRAEKRDLVIADAGLPSGTESILLVEDQEEVRRLAREVLQMLGYTVLEAENGRHALRVVDAQPDGIDLLLTDVVMPQIGGRDLADQLRASRPGLRVLYMSGHTDDAILHHGVLEPGVAFLQKPFAPEALAKRVREVLDQERA